MLVMIVYVALVAIGEVVAFFVCQAFDAFIPSTWSMLIYMALFFGVIWLMWPAAVFVTEKWFVKSVKGHAARAK